MSKNALWFLGLFLVFVVLFFVNTTLTDMDFDATLEIAATADLRAQVMGYDYAAGYNLEGSGLTYLSSLIKEHQRENEAFILIDAGGALSGNFVLDYILSRRKDSGLRIQRHPVLKAMEYMEYDAQGLSYREIKYGLDILNEIEKQNKVQFLNANIYDQGGQGRHFRPYVIRECTFKSTGRFVPLKVAIVGLIDPSVDQYLAQGIEVRAMDSELKELMPQLRKEGAGLVIADVHLGALQNSPQEQIRDKLDKLSKVEGLDLIVLGFDQIPGGHNGFSELMNSVPVIAPGTHASSVAFVRMNISYSNRVWQVNGQEMEIAQSTQRDANLEKIMAKDHQVIKSIVQDPLAKMGGAVTNYFSAVQDSFAEELVNEAQMNYVSKNIPRNQSGLPVVSLAAPMAFHLDEDHTYVTLPKGQASIADVLKFYNRAGTLLAIQITGKDVRDYLEWTSQAYIRVNTDSKEPQYFLNSNFPPEQFAMLDGVSYTVDLTQPSRYRNMSVATPNARRIKNLQYRNRPVRDGEQFLLVVNSDLVRNNPYLSQLEGSSFVWDSGVDVRSILLGYMHEKSNINVAPANNWRLTIDKPVELHFVGPATASEFLPVAGNGGTVQFIRKSSGDQGIYRYQPRLSAAAAASAASEDKESTEKDDDSDEKKSSGKKEK